MIKYVLLFLLTSSFLIADTEYAEPKPSIFEPRKIVFSIKSADNEEINHVLSSANNVLKYYGPENVNMKIVAYYHGIRALLKKENEFRIRVEALMLVDVEFVACGNTMRTKHIKKDELVDGTEVVTAGIVEIIELVKNGWINIVP